MRWLKHAPDAYNWPCKVSGDSMARIDLTETTFHLGSAACSSFTTPGRPRRHS
jgi:hypothetical protein